MYWVSFVKHDVFQRTCNSAEACSSYLEVEARNRGKLCTGWPQLKYEIPGKTRLDGVREH